jgi:hypothetical protein
MIRKYAIAIAIAALAWATPAAAQNPAVQPGDRSPCRDPWINIAIRELKGRAPNGSGESGECNIQLYGAAWNGYPQLRGFVDAALRRLAQYEARFTSDGTFYMDDDYGNVSAPAGQVRVISGRGMTDGAGNRAPDNGSQYSGSIALPNGVTIRFAHR